MMHSEIILNQEFEGPSFDQLEVGQLLIIERRRCQSKILVKISALLNLADGREVVLSKDKNDYFSFERYEAGDSWVSRIWAIPSEVKITAITNNLNEFPR